MKTKELIESNKSSEEIVNSLAESDQDKFRVLDVAAQYTSENLEPYYGNSWDAEQTANAIANDFIPSNKRDEFLKKALG